MTTPLKEALTALADALAKRPAEEILFDWFRSRRLVGALSVLIKRSHPDVQATIIMAATEDAREFLRANYPNLRFQLKPDMTQLREGEIRFVIDIQGVQFDKGAC